MASRTTAKRPTLILEFSYHMASPELRLVWPRDSDYPTMFFVPSNIYAALSNIANYLGHNDATTETGMQESLIASQRLRNLFPNANSFYFYGPDGQNPVFPKFDDEQQDHQGLINLDLLSKKILDYLLTTSVMRNQQLYSTIKEETYLGLQILLVKINNGKMSLSPTSNINIINCCLNWKQRLAIKTTQTFIN